MLKLVKTNKKTHNVVPYMFGHNSSLLKVKAVRLKGGFRAFTGL